MGGEGQSGWDSGSSASTCASVPVDFFVGVWQSCKVLEKSLMGRGEGTKAQPLVSNEDPPLLKAECPESKLLGFPCGDRAAAAAAALRSCWYASHGHLVGYQGHRELN